MFVETDSSHFCILISVLTLIVRECLRFFCVKIQNTKPHGIYIEFLEDFLSSYEDQIALWFAGIFLCQFLFLKLAFFFSRGSLLLWT